MNSEAIIFLWSQVYCGLAFLSGWWHLVKIFISDAIKDNTKWRRKEKSKWGNKMSVETVLSSFMVKSGNGAFCSFFCGTVGSPRYVSWMQLPEYFPKLLVCDVQVVPWFCTELSFLAKECSMPSKYYCKNPLKSLSSTTHCIWGDANFFIIVLKKE